MYVVTFAGKQFEVSNKKIHLINSIGFNSSLDVENQNTAFGKPLTLIKGPSLIEVSLDFKLSIYLGIDVYAEINQWQKMLENKTKGYLFIGNRPISNNTFLLKSLDVTDIKLSSNNIYLSANISIQLQEFVRKGVLKNDS